MICTICSLYTLIAAEVSLINKTIINNNQRLSVLRALSCENNDFNISREQNHQESEMGRKSFAIQ